MASRILVVDDEPNMRRTLEIVLGDPGRREIVTAGGGTAALALCDETIDLVIADLTMPDMDGLELLRRIRARADDVQFILMTAYSTVQSAVEAMRLGAFEYLIKPFADEELIAAVDRALERARPARRARRWRHSGAPALVTAAEGVTRLGEMVARSEGMRRLFTRVERAAESDATVLVRGESGTGKELVARAVHQLSRRRSGPFVAVNCAALTESLLESELFGHERGAFTGAVKTRVGRLEQAHGGTVFLDELGEMSAALQTKLLRALEERELVRVGGNETIRVDLRVVAATNRNLEQAIVDGLFREDLYYRLNVVPLEVPPLRERRDDIELLATLFRDEKCAELGVTPKHIAPETIEVLLGYDFPGNVRELENLIERAVVLCDGDTIFPEDVPVERRTLPRPRIEALVGGSLKDAWVALQSVVKDLERQLVERAAATYPDRPNEEIARLLGTSRRVLELRLQEFKVDKRSKS